MPPYETRAEQDEIDMKHLFSVLARYRISVVIITLSALLAASWYAYTRPSVYTASTLLKITSKQQGYYEDFLYVTSNGLNQDIQDEIVVLTSYPIVKKAVSRLQLGIRYFVKRKGRTVELYRHAPFRIVHEKISPELYGKAFELHPVDAERYRLVLREKKGMIAPLKSLVGLGKTKPSIHYDRVHRYGETVHTPNFSFVIEKTADIHDTYYFTVVPHEAMAGYVKQSLSASPVAKNSRIVSLRVADYVPERAALIANTIADTYIRHTLEQKNQSAKKQLHFIDMQLEAINKKLQHSADKLQKYKAMNVVVDLSEKSKRLSERLAHLESEHYKNSMLADRIRRVLHTLERNENGLRPYDIDIPVTDIEGIAPIVSQLRKALEQYETLSVNYTPNYPGIQKLLRQIGFLKRSLLHALKEKYRQLSDEIKRLQKQIDDTRKELRSIPEQEQEIEALSRHFLVNEKIYSYLLEKRAETAILASSTISNVTVVEKAQTPAVPTKPKRKLIVLVGFVLGLLVGIIQAFVRDFFNTTIHSPKDVEELTDIPVYAKLPYKDKKHAGFYNEAMRTLWINLSFVAPEKKTKIIAVTSDISQEGKTFTVANLAKTIARSTDKRIVVIDMDMRKPSLHEMFGITEVSDGVSTYLAGTSSANDVLLNPSEETNLFIIPAGPKAPNPTKLIMSERFETFLKELSRRFEYILIDTSPIGLVSDALKIMQYADLTLFIVRMNFSQKEYLLHLEQLKQKETGDIGLVLNAVTRAGSYYSDYIYKHYYMTDEREA